MKWPWQRRPAETPTTEPAPQASDDAWRMLGVLQTLCDEMGCEPGINRADFLRDRFYKFRFALERHHKARLTGRRARVESYKASQLCADTTALIGEVYETG